MAKVCNKEGCDYPVFSKGYCKAHQYLRKDYKQPSPVRKPIKRISDKRKAKNALYKVAREIFLQKNRVCQVCNNRKSTEIHHTYSGKDRDKYFLDESTWLAVDRICHNYIHDNPQWARKNNYLK
jgi:hypothetical protein